MKTILGYTWEEIQEAQQGNSQVLHPLITGELKKPAATKEDIALLEKHGKEGLEEMMFFGVLDRLQTSNLLDVSAAE